MLVLENTGSGAYATLCGQNQRHADEDDDDDDDGDDVMEQELYSSELRTLVAISSLTRVQ